MKTISTIFFLIILSSCISSKPPPLFISGSIEQIIDCQYEAALDTLHQLTITVKHEQKSHAFKYLGVVYREKGDLVNFNHTVDRFLFSRAGRVFQKHEVISDWVMAEREIKEARRQFIGKSECQMKF